jgi:hypothetical protein
LHVGRQDSNSAVEGLSKQPRQVGVRPIVQKLGGRPFDLL